jgi:hypothetical protein
MLLQTSLLALEQIVTTGLVLLLVQNEDNSHFPVAGGVCGL